MLADPKFKLKGGNAVPVVNKVPAVGFNCPMKVTSLLAPPVEAPFINNVLSSTKSFSLSFLTYNK